ncbi:hypothetical protein CXG81DRAFT_6164, partial [Caulochytrium protostelioides]
QTQLNAAVPRILQGQSEAPLTLRGKRQAQALAWRLSKESYTHVYCSSSKPARETVAAIAEQFPAVPITYDDRLREKDLGPLTGAPWPEAKRLLSAENRTFDDYVDVHAEKEKDFHGRVVDFYADLIDTYVMQPNERYQDQLSAASESAGTQPPKSPGAAARRGSLLGPASSHVHATHGHAKARLSSSKQIPQAHILVITHGGWITALIQHVATELGFRLPGEPAFGFPKNAAVYRLAIAQQLNPAGTDWDWEGTVGDMNGVSHLAGLDRWT